MNHLRLELSSEQTLRLEELRETLSKTLSSEMAEAEGFPVAHYCLGCTHTCFLACDSSCWLTCNSTCVWGCKDKCDASCTASCAPYNAHL
jgi:hypothetical protein